jgi:hypothetical protein
MLKCTIETIFTYDDMTPHLHRSDNEMLTNLKYSVGNKANDFLKVKMMQRVL